MFTRRAVTAAVCICLVQLSPASCSQESSSLFPKLHSWAGTYSDDADACSRDSLILKEAASNGTLWAARMVDSSAAEVSGALWGQRYHLGSFDGCLSAGAASPVGARYCLVNVSLVLPPRGEGKHLPPPWSHVEDLDGELPVQVALQGVKRLSRYVSLGQVHVGLCVPSACGAEQLQAGLRAHLSHLRDVTRVQVSVRVRPDMCTDHSELKGSASSPVWAFWFFMMFLSGVTLLAPNLGWTHWNWRLHFRALATPDPAPDGGVSVAPLSGIRFFATYMVVLAHRRMAMLCAVFTTNQFSREEDYNSILLSPLNHSQLNVDTFLFLSGILALALANSKRSNLGALLLRLSRIGPLYWLALVFYIFVLPELGSGPAWKYHTAIESSACRNHWLGNLLHINNYIPVPYLCLGQSWSLAVDMQLFLATLALRKYIRRGFALVVPLLVVSLLVQVVQLVRIQPEVAMFNPWWLWGAQFTNPLFYSVYTSAHMRAVPYVMGMGFGMILYGLQKSSVRLSALWTWVLTAGGVLVMGAVMALLTVVSDRSQPYSIWAALFYYSGAPIIWCIGLAGLIVALLFGVDTVVRDFLSWTPFVSLSRLGYGIYIAGAFVQIYTSLSKRDVENATEFSAISQSLTDLAYASLLSLWLHLIIEAPARSLAKSWMNRSNKETPKMSSKKDQ